MTKWIKNPSYEEVMKDNLPRVPNQIYWIDKPKLIWDIEVEGGWGWGETKTLYFTKWVWSWTGIIPFTWFWFTPTWYNIKAYTLATRTDTDGYSDSSYDLLSWTCQWAYWYNSWWRGTTINAIKVRVALWNRTQANHSAFISDGIELDFSDDLQNIWFTITAYK